MTTQISMKPTRSLKADPNNPRKLPDDADPRKEQWEKDLDRLGDDMLARGVLVPLLVRLDGTIIDGWRRWLAALRKGIKELPVIVTDTPEAEIPAIQLATVFHKADLMAGEKWLKCSEILATHPGWQLKDLAEFLHLDPSMLTRLLSPSKCIAAWQEALKDGKVGISDCYAASKLPESEQAGLLALKLSGASRDQIERAGRKSRNGKSASVKLARVKIAMPEATLVITGKELSMAGVVELLSETLKQARRAAEQYDVRTWQSMMKDKAKAGV
jgi:ParB family chromosome partitioning protein